MRKISFLIAAHNEEKIIGKAIENLLKIPYDNYEIIVGLDGCIDGTEEIIKKFMKKSKKLSYYSLNIRNGKPAVINEIIKKAKGEIVIINDADWIFKVKDKKKFFEFISVFNDEKIGGIAESFPVEWNENMNNANIGYKIVAYGTYYWIEFQKKRYSRKEGKFLHVTDPSLFLTNIFRKKLYLENSSLGDDFERTKDIFDQKYEIILLNNLNMPRAVSSYNSISIKGLLRQKIRTAMARKQLNEEKGRNIGLFNYYIPANWYMLTKSFNKRLYEGLFVLLWIMITSIGHFISVFRKLDTKKGWALRDKR